MGLSLHASIAGPWVQGRRRFREPHGNHRDAGIQSNQLLRSARRAGADVRRVFGTRSSLEQRWRGSRTGGEYRIDYAERDDTWWMATEWRRNSQLLRLRPIAVLGAYRAAAGLSSAGLFV